MSVRIMGAVWELDIPQTEKLVLLALADHADHEGNNARPSIELIGKKTGYSPRQVRRIYRSLEARGLIVPQGNKSGGRGRPTCYRVMLPDLTRSQNADIAKSVFDDRKRRTSMTKKADIYDQKGGHSYVRRTTKNHQEPPPPSMKAASLSVGTINFGGGGDGENGEIERVMKLLEAQNVKRNRRTLALAKRLATIGETTAQKLIEREAADLRRDKTARSFAAVLVARLEQADLEAERARLTETIRPVFQEVCLNGHAH